MGFIAAGNTRETPKYEVRPRYSMTHNLKAPWWLHLSAFVFKNNATKGVSNEDKGSKKNDSRWYDVDDRQPRKESV